MSAAKNWSRENIAWAAGLFEGEGTIWFKSGKKPCLRIGMTDGDVIKKFGDIIGCGWVSGPHTRASHPKYKPVWVWQCGGAEKCQAVLAAFWPHLGERRKSKAADAIKFMANMKPKSSDRKACPAGHPYDEENTYIDCRGQRVCRACRWPGRKWRKSTKLKQEALRNGLHKLHHATGGDSLRAA